MSFSPTACCYFPCFRGFFFSGTVRYRRGDSEYLKQAYVSARRIKALNPATNITVVSNPGVTPDGDDGVFDMVRDGSKSKRLYSWREER